jgi:hypothetical protein
MDERPFVDMPIGTGSEPARAASQVAAELGLSAPILLRVGMNAIFRSEDVVLRVGRPTADANLGIELARGLRDRGIPALRPWADQAFEVGDLSVTLWEFCVTAAEPIAWDVVGRSIRRVHALELDDFPIGYPTPHPKNFPWWDFDSQMREVSGVLDPQARRGLEAAIERNREWDQFDKSVICHGDVHPGNVVMTADGPVLLDWDLLCDAAPGWDHAMLISYAARWGGDEAAYRLFAKGYGVDLAGDPQTVSLAELRNVAATLMRVKASQSDPTAADEANRRLEYWRGAQNPPVWRAQ